MDPHRRALCGAADSYPQSDPGPGPGRSRTAGACAAYSSVRALPALLHQRSDPHRAEKPGEPLVGPAPFFDQAMPQRAVQRGREHIAALLLADGELAGSCGGTRVVAGRIETARVELGQNGRSSRLT